MPHRKARLSNNLWDHRRQLSNPARLEGKERKGPLQSHALPGEVHPQPLASSCAKRGWNLDSARSVTRASADG